MCEFLKHVENGDRLRIRGKEYEVLWAQEEANVSDTPEHHITPYLAIYLHDNLTNTLFPTHKLIWEYENEECELIGENRERVGKDEILLLSKRVNSAEGERHEKEKEEREVLYTPIQTRELLPHRDWEERLARLIQRFLSNEHEKEDVLRLITRVILTARTTLEAWRVRMLAVLHDRVKHFAGSTLERLNISMLCQILTGCEGVSVFGVKTYPAREEYAAVFLRDATLLGFPREEVEGFVQWCLTKGRRMWSISVSEERRQVREEGGVIIAYEHEAERREHARFLLAFLFPKEKEIPLHDWSREMPEAYWQWRSR